MKLSTLGLMMLASVMLSNYVAKEAPTTTPAAPPEAKPPAVTAEVPAEPKQPTRSEFIVPHGEEVPLKCAALTQETTYLAESPAPLAQHAQVDRAHAANTQNPSYTEAPEKPANTPVLGGSPSSVTVSGTPEASAPSDSPIGAAPTPTPSIARRPPADTVYEPVPLPFIIEAPEPPTYTPFPEPPVGTEPEEQPAPTLPPEVEEEPEEPTPVPTLEPTPEPAPEPTPEPTPAPAGGYAICSCGATLTPDEVVPHMKQHALNGESHSYRAY